MRNKYSVLEIGIIITLFYGRGNKLSNRVAWPREHILNLSSSLSYMNIQASESVGYSVERVSWFVVAQTPVPA